MPNCTVIPLQFNYFRSPAIISRFSNCVTTRGKLLCRCWSLWIPTTAATVRGYEERTKALYVPSVLVFDFLLHFFCAVCLCVLNKIRGNCKSARYFLYFRGFSPKCWRFWWVALSAAWIQQLTEERNTKTSINYSCVPTLCMRQWCLLPKSHSTLCNSPILWWLKCNADSSTFAEDVAFHRDTQKASEADAKAVAAVLTVAINNRYSTSSYEASDEEEPSTDDDTGYLSPSDDNSPLIDSAALTRWFICGQILFQRVSRGWLSAPVT